MHIENISSRTSNQSTQDAIAEMRERAWPSHSRFTYLTASTRSGQRPIASSGQPNRALDAPLQSE